MSMVATPRSLSVLPGDSSRPYAFLVSTTGCARGIKGSLGSSAYSYYFVLEALAPVLEQYGIWKLLDKPESSLPFQAARMEAEGYQPVHLALHPPQDVYLTPALPNIIFPFWEFPDIPAREFNYDTRQNWKRVCARADLIITACQFTADTFRQAGIDCPIAVVPVPLKPAHFAVPDWKPEGSWTHTCRHVVWGGPPAQPIRLEATVPPEMVEQIAEAVHDADDAVEQAEDEAELSSRMVAVLEEVEISDAVAAEAEAEAKIEEVEAHQPAPALAPAPAPAPKARISVKRRGFLVARAVFRKVYPWLGAKTVNRIARTRYYLLAQSGRDPVTMAPLPGARPGMSRLAYAVARDGYRRYVKRWLSQEALEAISHAKTQSLQVMTGQPEPVVAPDPLLPSEPVTISGLVFTSIFNLGDRRKNHLDLLTAFLLAFRDRDDVTLVIKLATNPTREHHEISLLRLMYQGLRIEHRCRLVVITDFLTDEGMADLMRVTTCYVNTSKAEGACLPLQQSLAGGRPSIAPDHTAMADFMDEEVGWVLKTSPEPTYWPHDPDMRIETYWNRLDWVSLRDRLLEAAETVENDFPTYREKARAARKRMAGYASRELVGEALGEALAMLPAVTTGRFAWSS